MRDVPPGMDAAWLFGAFEGDNRAMARCTIQHVDARVFDLGYNVYASYIFGTQAVLPKELPNVKSVKWNRGVDSDVAQCTIELYNTAPQPVGTTFQPMMGLDQPGYYTFTRGTTSFSARWGQTANEWQGMVVPDNVIRTFEGYGFDATTCPESDPHLVQTGVWRIMDVEYTAGGLITVTCEDLASILRDQIAFYPVIPSNFYPLTFAPGAKPSGFVDGYTYTKSVDSGGGFDPAYPPPKDWTGPTAAPTLGAIVSSDKGFTVNWTRVTDPHGTATYQAALDTLKNDVAHHASAATVAAAKLAVQHAIDTGYDVVGYQVIVDGQRLPTRYGVSATSAIVNPTSFPGITNGNVYHVNIVAIYKRLKDGYELASVESGTGWAYPANADITIANLTENDAVPNPDPHLPAVVVPGVVGWDYSGGDTVDHFVVVVHRGGVTQTAFTSVAPAGAGRQRFDTQLGDLTGLGILVYPVTASGAFGHGAALPDAAGVYLNPPTNGVPPHEPLPATKQATVTTSTGITSALRPSELGVGFSNTSNTYYVGKDGSVYGHKPEDALDGSMTSYWLSIGNARNDQGYSYEWYEVSVPHAEVTDVQYKTAKSNYHVYISVYAKGNWVHYDPSDIIPYDPNNPESHNGGNKPYVYSGAEPAGEGPHRITLKRPVPGATKVRITFHNLQNFGLGFPYRAGLRDIKVYGRSVATSIGGTPPPAGGPVQDDDDPSITQTYTVYVPPVENPGAGEQPGFYEDYTDIVKLMCAWGGLYWPEGATYTDSCGTTTTYSWGPGLYGLKNVDPVLGDQSSGRVWGDFQQTGTSSVVPLPIQQWDKKTLLDCISVVRDIIGYIFFIDETGGAVWRMPNIFSLGNYTGDISSGHVRVNETVTIDERQTLIDLRAKLSSRNVRERYFVASVDGVTGALAAGYNPNPAGLRRVGGWTDQHFGDIAECQMMADLIALRALMVYRVDTIRVPGYPRIQIEDQVRIYERVTNEGYLHYVRGISSSNDLESGEWFYDLDTSWLGESPFEKWIFEPSQLSAELQSYLKAMDIIGSLTDNGAVPPDQQTNPPGPTSQPPPDGASGGTTKDVMKVAKLVRVAGQAPVYVTDGITKRHVTNPAELTELVVLGLVPSGTSETVSQAFLDALVTVAPTSPLE